MTPSATLLHVHRCMSYIRLEPTTKWNIEYIMSLTIAAYQQHTIAYIS